LSQEQTPAAGRSGKLRRVVTTLAGPIILLGVIAYVVARHGSDIQRAADRASLGTLALVTLLAGVALVARSETAVACLTAMGDRPRRLDIHPASAAAFVVGTINHYVASPARAAMLQRLDRERAPTIPQMILVDASTYLIEGLLAAVLLIISASVLKLQWWMPVLVFLAAVTVLGLVIGLRGRLAKHPAFRGLDVLAHSRERVRVVLLSIVIFASQIVRTLLVLRATGLHPSLLQAAATFVAAGVLSGLLTGPAAGTAGAPLVIFGHRALGAATAAGLLLSATALLAALIYAALCAPVYVHRTRRPTAPVAVSAPVRRR
jgi:uncharacterized membrane protein YbhN (UPF0104 family)